MCPQPATSVPVSYVVQSSFPFHPSLHNSLIDNYGFGAYYFTLLPPTCSRFSSNALVLYPVSLIGCSPCSAPPPNCIGKPISQYPGYIVDIVHILDLFLSLPQMSEITLYFLFCSGFFCSTRPLQAHPSCDLFTLPDDQA